MTETDNKRLDELASLINEKEEAFQKAQYNNAEPSLLSYIKKDIDYFREEYVKLFNKQREEK